VKILGISAYYHDSAAALVCDGEIVAAAQEERFTRKKHDAAFPARAIAYCLEEAQLRVEDLDLVAFYDKPLLKFDRMLETYLAVAPAGFKMFLMGLRSWLTEKLFIPRELHRGLEKKYKNRFVFTEHHESHAASAFYPSPFDEAAVLTLDGVGEWATGSIAHGQGNQLRMLKELRFPHSLGLLYSTFTYFTGFRVNSGEYKLMGLAPYGTPVYRDLILQELLDLKDDGSFRMNMSYFGYCSRDVMSSRKLDRLFGGPPRRAESDITQREMDIAASIQAVTEEIMLRIARHAHEITGCRHLALAGGVALNCVGNGRILREGPFDRVWVQPASGDAGGALGTALFCWYQLLDNPRAALPEDSQRGSLLGPHFSSNEVRSRLDRVGARYLVIEEADQLYARIAKLLADERVVGHFAGRMEFGPRALGARSILGDPRSPSMQSTMNRKIKFRESFRPFAPAILSERASEYFELGPEHESPYMLFVAPVDAKQRIPGNSSAAGLAKLSDPRSRIPAVTHVDGSARVQTVDSTRNPRLHGILRAFERETGCPLLINTSFNVRGEPIVCTPEDAFRCFMATDMDALIVEDCILLKEEQAQANRSDRDRYLAEFALD